MKKKSYNFFACLLLLIFGLLTGNTVAKAQCTFTPTSITIHYPQSCGLGNVAVTPSQSSFNNAPTWLSSTNSHQIKWNNNRWEISYFGIALSYNSTGTITSLPATGWLSTPEDEDGICGALTLSGGYGSLTAPVPPSLTVTANPSFTITGGNSTTLTVTGAAGYKWSANAGNATSASVVVSTAAVYSVTGTTNGCSGTKSVTVSLSTPPIDISTAASPLTVCAGNSVALSVTATGGTAPYSFTWIAPASAAITGSANGTAATGTINTGASGVQTFTVLVSDAGQPLPVMSSAIVSVTVVGIDITKQPASASAVCAGTQVTVPVSASGAISAWQWYKDSTPIDGQTTATLSLTNPAVTDSGEYRLVITGDCNSVTTTAFILTVSESIAVTQEPASQSVVCEGAGISVPVSITGAGGSMQWYKGNTPVTSQTTTTLSLTGVTISDAGIYRLVVTGGCNSVTSAAFSLSINTAPVISINPSSTLITGGSSISLTANGGQSYTWNTGASLPVISVSPAATTQYSVSALHANGCAGVATATVSVTCSVLSPAKAISATVTTALAPGNCAVIAEGQGTGSSFMFTGPGGYVYSSVYRRVGTYTVKGPNITMPGVYTFTASTSNACGQVSSESITYVVTGSACQ